MCCVLFNGGLSCRKIKLVYTTFKIWNDAGIVVEGILSHFKSMENCKSFSNGNSQKKGSADKQLRKSTDKQVDKNGKVLLSIIDVIKTIGKIGVPLRGDRDDSRYQLDVGKPENYPGVGNFIELINILV